MAPRSLPPAKKRKVEHDPAVEERIRSIETALLESLSKNQSLNSLADLLDIVQSTRDAQLTSKAVYAAYRVFVVVIVNGKLGLGGDEAARLVKSWLLTQLNTYVEFLTGLLKDEEKTLRVNKSSLFFVLVAHINYLWPDIGSSNLIFSTETSLYGVLHFLRFLQPPPSIPFVTFPQDCFGSLNMPTIPPIRF
jgi:U3 small nucleolar RNA-associated protein 19